MNCSEIQNLLSAYHDGELSSEIREDIVAHLQSCQSCSSELAMFEQISTLAAELDSPVPPSNMWDELEMRLQEESNRKRQSISQLSTSSVLNRLQKYSLLFVAAMLFLAVGIGYLNRGDNGQGTHHHSSPVFNQYLTAFKNDPDSAQQILLKNYQNTLVKPDQAVKLLGYQPAVASRLPAEYEIESSYVMKMPCCTCLQTVCKRKDGSRIVIFEHDDETPEWFEGQERKTEICSGEECCLINLDRQIAASWKRDKRHITVIGIRDMSEVNELIAWSGQTVKKS